MTDINPTDPSQVSYPWRASLRTAVQTFLAVLLALTAIAEPLTDFVAEFWPDSPVLAWIAGGAALAGGIALLITRITALEKVNDLLTRFNLGATPK